MDQPAPLPDCSSFANPCETCYLGASTTFLDFPFNVTQTVDVTVVALVTGLADGSNSTYGFETITADFETESGEQTVLEDQTLTWVTDGATLTFPTTYASFVSFYGNAAPSASPPACATRTELELLTFPATTAPASLIYTPVAGTDASTELTAGQLPTAVLAYLGELDTVVEQLSGNAPSQCARTTASIFTSDVTCVSISTSTSCVTSTADGTPTSSCATMTEIATVTLTDVPTTGPTPPATDKVAAAALRRTAGPAKFTPYSPPPGADPTPRPADPQPQEGGTAPNPNGNNNGGNNGGNNNGGNNGGTNGGTNGGGTNSGTNGGINNGGTNDGSNNSSGGDSGGNNSPALPDTPSQPSTPTDGTSGSSGEFGQGGQPNPATGGQSASPQDGTSQSGENSVSAPVDGTSPSSADSASAPQGGSSGSSSSSSSSAGSPPQSGQGGSSDAAPNSEGGSTSSESEQTPPDEESSSNSNNSTPPPSPNSDDSSGGGANNDDTSGSSPAAAAGNNDPSSPSSSSTSSDDDPSDPTLTNAPSPGSSPSSNDGTSGSGTTGAGDYIMSGLDPGPSRTLTSVGSAGTSVTVEPYTGSAGGRASASLMACSLGLMVGMGFAVAGL